MDKYVNYNLEAAAGRLIVAKNLLDDNFLIDSVNRSYYAMFYSARALVQRDQQNFSKHSAVISYFQREYIKTGIFDKNLSDYIRDAFALRNNSDYSYFALLTKEDAESQYNHAVEFYEAIKNYLEGN